jgi:hypothetical protein
LLYYYFLPFIFYFHYIPYFLFIHYISCFSSHQTFSCSFRTLDFSEKGRNQTRIRSLLLNMLSVPDRRTTLFYFSPNEPPSI